MPTMDFQDNPTFISIPLNMQHVGILKSHSLHITGALEAGVIELASSVIVEASIRVEVIRLEEEMSKLPPKDRVFFDKMKEQL